MGKWGDRGNFRQIVEILTRFIEQSFLLVKELFVISVDLLKYLEGKQKLNLLKNKPI